MVTLGGLAETPNYSSPCLFNSQSASRVQMVEEEGEGEEVDGTRTAAAHRQQTNVLPYDFSPNVTSSAAITPPSVVWGGRGEAPSIPHTKMVAALPSSEHITAARGRVDHMMTTPTDTAIHSSSKPPLVEFVMCVYRLLHLS